MLVAHRGGRALLGVVPVEFEVAEFGVRHQRAVDQQRAADSGAERQQDDHARHALGRAEARLGDAGGVGVVEHDDLVAAAGRLGEARVDVGADPALVDVGG